MRSCTGVRVFFGMCVGFCAYMCEHEQQKLTKRQVQSHSGAHSVQDTHGKALHQVQSQMRPRTHTHTVYTGAK